MLGFMQIKREQLRLETERNILLNLIIKHLKDIQAFMELTISK